MGRWAQIMATALCDWLSLRARCCVLGFTAPSGALYEAAGVPGAAGAGSDENLIRKSTKIWA